LQEKFALQTSLKARQTGAAKPKQMPGKLKAAGQAKRARGS
jgi:hypothetical protein